MYTQHRFGAFFRKSRKALGLTLREFCRRNGFDAGNISRLERGIIPPPKAKEALDSYAKALRIQDGSSEWEMFYDMAGAETGQIPKEALANKSTVQNLPTLFRILRGQRHLNWVTEVDLEGWAGTLAARSRLSQVIRRLVYASIDSLVRITFPSGEGVQRPGWDGIVEAGAESAFVPHGTSGWELGVDQDPRRKAEEEYRKRTKDPLGLEKSETTFVFVTPRKWSQKREWCQEKNTSRTWKEVRAYDSADLEEWLEMAPGVDAWFARIIGKRPVGLTDLDEHWSNLAALTDPSLSPEVFLTSRHKEIEEFRNWLKTPPSALVMEARSPAEVMDFLAAFLAKSPSEEQEEISARALVIEQKETWRAVATSGKRMVLMPHPSFGIEPELVAEAVRSGHHVVLPSNRFSNERFQSLTLPRAYGFDLQNALVACGFSQEQANKAAKESGGSMTVLKRLLAHVPGTTEPEWSRLPQSTSLVPFILAGSWDESSEGDRSMMETLSGQQYEQVRLVAEQTLTLPDSPLLRVLSRWFLVSREDSWFLLAPSIVTQDVERFSKVALQVLTETNPALDLPPENRWQAAWQRKTPTYTETLRKGISESLVLLAARSEKSRVSCNLEGHVQTLVKTVLGGADWKRWTSFSRHLPLLAEASPEAFLDAVESGLGSASPAVFNLFEQGSNDFFSSHPHTGLLWALENLAWATDYLPRVALILAHFVQLDPKVAIGNHPMNSLREIFLPWYPQTSAPVERRIKVLDKLLKEYPKVAWDLLLQLLPNIHSASMPTYRPSWRDWAVERSKGVTNAEYWEQVMACANRLVAQAGNSVKRCMQIINNLNHFPEPVHKDAIAHLASLNVSELDKDARREVTEALRETVHKHRRFAEADWALPPDTVNALERLQKAFEPQDVVTKHAWLFGPHWDVLEEMTGESIQAQQAKLFEVRTKAMEEVFSTQGITGIFSLVDVAKAPEEVGFVAGKSRIGMEEKTIIPKLLIADDEKICRFARGYAQGSLAGKEKEWVGSLNIVEWSVPEAGELLLLLPFEVYTWNLVAVLGSAVEEYYWSRVPKFCHSDNKEDVGLAVSMLLKYHRPFHACDVLVMALHQKCEIDPNTVLQVLQMGLTAVGASEVKRRNDRIGYNVQKLITWLQSITATEDSPVDESRLAAIEWGYQGLLEGTPASPVTLHRMLQRNPEFFAEVLGAIYRKKSEAATADQPPSDQDQAQGETAYRLLNSWHAVPGTEEDGQVNPDALMNWVKSARQLCQEQDRLEVCDIQLGNVLAYSPKEADGTWPCVAVRDVIEEVESETLARGFEIGIFNKRGSYMKSHTEGGAQEWGLAQKYQAWADACGIDWPKTARSLRSVASKYEIDARREDAETQVDR
jgi:transcriptional regulator with XRE-family HTH domain